MSWVRSYFQTLIPIGFFVIFMIGCKVGPRFEQPEIDSPESFRFSDSLNQSSADDLKWWEMFDDPMLDSLIGISLENNKDVLMAASRVEQSRYNLGYTRSNIYPQFSYSAGATSGNYGGGLLQFDQTQNVFYANAQVAWELDFWGKFRRGNEAAKAEMIASTHNLRAIQISLISEVAKTYFKILDMSTRHRISKKTLESRDSGLAIINARFDKGIVPLIDVNQAQIQKSVAQASVPLYRRQQIFAENNMAVLLGQNPSEIKMESTLYQQDIPPEIPVGLPSELLMRRPEILKSQELLHAQTAKIGVAEAYRFPSISLTGLLGAASSELSTFGASGLSWNAGAGLLGPLFQFNKNKRKVQIERAKMEQALYQYEQDILNAFREVEDALVSIQSLKLELSARADQRKAALSSEKLSFERYNQGVTSYLEVLENQRAAFKAELIYSQTYQDLLSAYVKLYKVLGGGWLSEDELKASQENQEE